MRMNRSYNCHNPNQGKAKKVLCVCSAGLLRSPTTAIVLQKEYGYNTRAVGIDISHALIPIDEVLCEWADEIVCMEKYQIHRTQEMLKSDTPIICLDINDDYKYMDSELQKLVLQKYKEKKQIRSNLV